MNNICFTISLFHASTCFEHMCSSSGGKKIVLYSLWYHHTYRWPSGAQVERGVRNFDAKLGSSPLVSNPCRIKWIHFCKIFLRKNKINHIIFLYPLWSCKRFHFVTHKPDFYTYFLCPVSVMLVLSSPSSSLRHKFGYAVAMMNLQGWSLIMCMLITEGP